MLTVIVMQIAALALCLLLGSAAAALAQPRKVEVPRSEETIGSWLLSCAIDPMTDGQVCRMRHKLWLVEPADGRPGMALEVLSRSDVLLPALTVRDLSFGSAWTGLLGLTATAQLRFDGTPMVELPCALEGMSVICAPSKADAPVLAERLAKARSVLVRFRAVGNLPLPVPDGPLALDLDRTQEALTRFRLAGPEPSPAPTSITQDLKDSAERLLRRLGVPGMEPAPAPPK